MSIAGEHDEKPNQQQADWQTADVAEKKPGYRSIEWSKACRRTAQSRGSQESCVRRKHAGKTERGQRRCDWENFSHGHPVNPVHEIDQVYKPDRGDEEQ